jgi:hypothetical protein
MKPRGFWGTFAIMAGITAPLSGLACLILIPIFFPIGFGQALRMSIVGGLAFGILFGFVIASFMKAVTISIEFQEQEKEALLSQLNVALAEMGYHPESQTDTFLTFKPSFQAGLLAGKISVQIEQNSVTIVGPNTYIKKLQQQLCNNGE